MTGFTKTLRSRAILVVAVLLALATARDTLAARFTPHLDALASELSVRADDDQTPAALRKLYKQQLKLLAKPTTTVAQDIKTAAKIIPALEKKAGDDVAIITAATNAIRDFASAVTALVVQADADANALRMKSDPLVKIDRYLLAAHDALSISTIGATLNVRIKALRKAILSALKANTAIVKAGGGGGGGGNACGPSPAPAGLRVLAAGESFTAHVVDFDRTYDFVGGSVTAKAGPRGGFQGAPVVLEVFGYDCTKQSAIGFDIPYPPTVDQTYLTGMSAAEAMYKYVWDGFTQIYPTGASFKATAFDAGAKTATIAFDFGNVQGTVTLKSWN